MERPLKNLLVLKKMAYRSSVGTYDLNCVTINIDIDSRKLNVSDILLVTKLNNVSNADINKKKGRLLNLMPNAKKYIQKLACLVFETEVYIASGGANTSDLNTPPLEKGTVSLGSSTPKIPIGTVVKVFADLRSSKCEHGGRTIVKQVCGEGGDVNSIIKYDKLASSVGTESDVPLLRIKVIIHPYFALSKMRGTDCICKCRQMKKRNHTIELSR